MLTDAGANQQAMGVEEEIPVHYVPLKPEERTEVVTDPRPHEFIQVIQPPLNACVKKKTPCIVPCYRRGFRFNAQTW